jgi:hypothetical protein
VILAATNFVMEIRVFPIRAAMITFFDPEAMEELIKYLGIVVYNRNYLWWIQFKSFTENFKDLT